jgi:hypothetical protein
LSLNREGRVPIIAINSNNIADWCSNDRQILVTPSCFAVRPFLLTSLLINIYFPTYNKMAIIGTLPSRFSDKNQLLYKGSLIRACAYKLFQFPSKVSRLVTYQSAILLLFIIATGIPLHLRDPREVYIKRYGF